MTYKKKLIEVALPLDAINRGAKKDKDRKTGTIRSIHKWFAPMPSAAVRAILYAALVDSPEDPTLYQEVMKVTGDLAASGAEAPPQHVLDKARRHISDSFRGSPSPLVLDPFCGGGSTAVEAQRLGLDCMVSDLNPIAVLITQAATWSVPAFDNESVMRRVADLSGQIATDPYGALTSVVEHYAKAVYERAREQIGHLYPSGSGGATILAWRWCRTAPSPDPAFVDVDVPLVRDWWFSKRADQRAFAVPKLDANHRRIHFEISREGEPILRESDKRCMLSGAPITFDYLRSMGKQGKLRLRCIGALAEEDGVRAVIPVSEQDERAALDVHIPEGLRDLPLPAGGLGFRIQAYGLKTWSEMFLPRQVLALYTFASVVAQIREEVHSTLGDRDAAQAVIRLLGLAVGRMASYSSTQSLWRIDSRSGVGQPEAAFGRAALPMTMDFVETNPFGGSRGDWMVVVNNVLAALKHVSRRGPLPVVMQLDAAHVGRAIATPCLVFTDPPYFGQIGYADLSDYFYPWIRLALKDEVPDLFSTMASPKDGELIADPSRHGSVEDAYEFFEKGFREVFGGLKKLSDPRVPILVVYAQRQQESRSSASQEPATGWEAMLEAVLSSGLGIVGTWPIHGTGTTRQRAQKSSALATYVLLVCRPRNLAAAMATRAEFLDALRTELPSAVRLLQAESILPVDLAQSAIGPGMAVFSRFGKVVESDGSAMTVRRALTLINEVLQEMLSAEETEFDADTRWALTWYEENGFGLGSYGRAETLSKAKDTSVAGVVNAGIARSRDGMVKLLDPSELAESWDPMADQRATVWELTHHLIRRLESSELEAADLLRRVGGGYGDRARQLAYLLFDVAERKGRAKEAVAYNSLIQAWPDLVRLAGRVPGPVQQTLGSE